MTYFERILLHYGLTKREFYEKCREFRPNVVSYKAICGLCGDPPTPIRLEKLKYIALMLNCNYIDLISGAGPYKGLVVTL